MSKVINRITREDVMFFECWTDDAKNPGKISNMMDDYQRIATKSAIYPGKGTPLGLMYVGLKLNGEAGEIAEHVGKAFRDDGLVQTTHIYAGEDYIAYANLTTERRELIIKEIGDMLWYLSATCNELGINLSDAALRNLEKLCDRTERDALRGSGDER